MKLTTFILIASMLQVSAASFGQEVTLNQRNITVEKIFMEIRKQTGYDVLISTTKFKTSQKINADFKNASLDQVMGKITKGTSLSYTIEEKTIVVSEKIPTLIDGVKDKINSLFQQQIDVTIYLKDAKGNPLPGGSARILSTGQFARANEEGIIATFTISKDEKVSFTYVGYKTKEIIITAQPDVKGRGLKTLTVILEQNPVELNEVAVEASNGYQNLLRERSTGSYEVITAKQLQHSNDPNLIRRLEGITTSLVINNQNILNNSSRISPDENIRYQNSPLTNLTIRGKNTLNGSGVALDQSNSQSGIPLVVIDGVASPYSIDLVNPDDVENITILKDAAAASIWGARAANGVIVVQTKKGRYNRQTTVSFNSNVNITEKLDLYYKPTMSTSDYIDAQVFAYSKTNPTNPIPDPTLNPSFLPIMITPVAEIMNEWKKSTLSPIEKDAKRDEQLNALRGNDIRKDFTKYFLRNAVNQNYSLNISGGSKMVNYNLSGGYQKTLNNTKNSGSDKINVSYSASAKPLRNLELSGNIGYSLLNLNSQVSGVTGPESSTQTFFPYTRLADDQGNALDVPKNYRPVFIKLLETNYGDNILDMHYKPLDDINEGYYKAKNQNVNLNFSANYKALSWLSANVLYNYSASNNQQEKYYSQNSFFMRNMINLYTVGKGAKDPNYPDKNYYLPAFTRIIPLGGGYVPITKKGNNQTFSGRINIDKSWNEKNVLSSIAGIDIAQNYSLSRTDNYYGYDPQIPGQFNNHIDYFTRYKKLFPEPGGFASTSQIPFIVSPGIIDYKVRTFSLFANSSYTYDRRYTIFASVRRDASSEFGVGTNKNGTPFYSTGLAWNINEEKFYHVDWLPLLSLRTSFGYLGNVNPVVIGRPVLNVGNSTDITGFRKIGQVNGIPNRNLRPEKTAELNFRLDFGIKGDRVSGSFDYFDKRTTDLIAGNVVDPSFGFLSNPQFNTGNLHGYGIDFTLNTINIKSGSFTWGSSFLFSYNRVKVTKLFVPGSRSASDLIGGVNPYDVGYDRDRLFAYKWAGLDPLTGDPRGFVDGKAVSINAAGNNFTDIENAPGSTARYFGSSVPVYFGSFRNGFTYKQLTVSANFVYKLGYYFRRSNFSDLVQYSSLFSLANAIQPAEYNQRWQNPGDELKTNVPSLVYPNNNYRDNFYSYSEVNVVKADHIRLQEINLSYSIKTKQSWFIKNPRIYANVSNLGIIWRANKLGLDPDANDYPNPRTYGFGFSASF